MKKLVSVFVALFAAGVILTTPASAQQQPIELSLNLIIPPIHTRYISAIKPWIAEVEKRTHGRLKITPYFSSTLSPMPEVYDSVVSGLADMAEAFVGLNPGRFPVAELMGLPDVKKTCKNPSRVIWELYKKFPDALKEFKDTHLLVVDSCLWEQLHTAKKPVRSLEDARGLKIFAGTKEFSNTIKALGMSPVTMGMGDIYSGLEKGVIEGVVLPNDVLKARKLAEVLHYGTEVSLGYQAFYLVMNTKRYNSLPVDIRKVIDDLSGDYLVDLFAKAQYDINEEGEKFAVEKCHFQYVDLLPGQMARWEEALKPLWDQAATSLDARGLPGKKILDELQTLLVKYNQ